MPTVDFNLVPVASSTDFEVGYGPLFQQSFTARNGDTMQVTLGLKGYTGTTYADDVASYSLNEGTLSDRTISIRRSLLAQVKIATDTTALIQALKGVTGSDTREYRLKITRGGTTEFIGFCVPSATTTRINENRLQVVTLRAKDRILSLDQPYDLRDSSETVTYATAITDILKTLGLNLGLTVQMGWRPAQMALSDDPLSMQVPCSAWYRTDQDGVQRALKRGEVLDDLVGTLGMQIIQSRGTWTLQQPSAHRTGSTVTVWSYSSNGTLQGSSTTRAAVVDITNEGWTENSDEVSSQDNLKDSYVEYEHNSPNLINFNGGFDNITLGEPDDWVWWANDGAQEAFGTNFTLLTASALVEDGTRALSIEGSQAPSATTDIDDYPQYADRFAEIAIGFLADSAGGVTLNLNARRDFTAGDGTGDPPVEPGAAQAFWSMRLDTDSGDYFWVEGDGWTLESNLSSADDKKNAYSDIQLAGNYVQESYDIDEAPALGTLYLRVYEAVARPQDTGSPDDDDFIVYAYWDALTIAPQKTPTGVTTYHNFDAGAESGGSETFVTRLGDGPYAGSDGALLDDAGVTTAEWSEDGDSITFELGELLAKRRMGLLREDPATIRLEVVDPSTTVFADRAIEMDGVRYWPLSIKRNEPSGRVKVYAAELLNQGYPSGYEVFSGRAGLVESGGSPSGGGAGSGAAAGVSSFNGRTGQVELLSGDVTGALGYTPQDSASPGVTKLDGKQGDIEVESGVLDIPDTSPPTLQIVADSIDADKISFISVDTSTTPDSYTIAGNVRVQGDMEADGDVSAFGSGSGSGSGAGTIAIKDSGVSVNTEVSTINFGDNADVTDDGGGQITVDVTASASAPVDSVFGRTGDVTAQTGDYSASQISGFDSAASDAAPVQSVFGRTGTVTAQTGDYSATQITNFDSQAVSAVNAETSLSVDISGTANNANNLGGQPATDYARTDISTESFPLGLEIDGYTFAQDANGDLQISTPSGNKVLIGDDGDLTAFA